MRQPITTTITTMHTSTTTNTTTTTTTTMRQWRGRMVLLLLVLLLLAAPGNAQREAVSVGIGSNSNKNSSVSGSNNKQKEATNLGQVMGSDARNKLQKIDLSFASVKLVLQKKGNDSRTILDGSLKGRAQPGRMLAIMGPSGAGKSAFLHALSGRLKYNSKLHLHGQRYINGEPVTGDSRIPAAFVEQDVNFFPQMTVRETLSFRVEFELGRNLSPSARNDLVNDLLRQTGLTAAADTIVGNSKVRGISGGERKRLSIAVELISSPSLLFLDEPTSGLDSTAATNLVETLRQLANAGKTVIAVIHQPSQHVFAKFDDLLLISEGKQMYFGALNKVRQYMESKGYRAAAEMGTAEHILDCISRSALEGESPDDVDARMEKLQDAANDSSVDFGPSKSKSGKQNERHFVGRQGGPKAGVLKQFKLLLKRSARESFRGKTVLILKTVQQVTTGLIYGLIYKLGTNQASIQDRFGLLSLIAIGSANLSMAAAIRSFPKEKAIVSNELASRQYRTLPYLLAKALSELPLNSCFNALFGSIVYYLTGLSRTAGKFRRFIGVLILHGMSAEAVALVVGAFSPNSDVALSMLPALFIVNVIFDGKNISEESIPRFLRWLPKIGNIRWGFEGLAVNEFDGLEFDTSGPRRGPAAKTGADALDRFGLGKNSLSYIVRAQLIITATSWALSFLGLTLTKQKYLTMKKPDGKMVQS